MTSLRSYYHDRNKFKYTLIIPIVTDYFSLISHVNDNHVRPVFNS